MVLIPLWLRKTVRWTLYLSVVAGVAAAGAAGFLWYSLGDINQQLAKTPRLHIPQLARSDVGSAQTILLIGADTRWSERRAGDRGRSDTMILMRLDPDNGQTTLLSIPRDLRIMINGHAEKFNASYSYGGASGVVRAIKQNLGVNVNHVFEVSFGAFSRSVDALGCAYVDVDRRYYHKNLPGYFQWSEINLQPGYQKLCGEKALQYVRFRHTDDDYVRSLRQQDFLHQLSSQYNATDLVEKRDKLLGIMGQNVRTDLRGRLQIAEVLRLMAYAYDKPVRQIPWQGTDQIIDGLWYALATPSQLRANVQNWLHPPHPKPKRPTAHHAKKTRSPRVRMSSSVMPSAQQASVLRHYGWQVYLPTQRPPGSIYIDSSPRAYQISDQWGNLHPAYRAVLVDRGGHSWGIQGVGWDTPPLVKMVHQTAWVGSRQLRYYWDGGRMRFCALQVGGWWYWVSNSLSRSLSSAQMMATCRSLTRFK